LSGNIQTNNRAELTAFIQANTLLDEDIDPGGNEKKIFYTDCMLLVTMIKGGLQKRKVFGWKKTKNEDLLMKVSEIVDKNEGRLTVHHVYAHTGSKDWKSKWNAEADRLAKLGADLHPWYNTENPKRNIQTGPEGGKVISGPYLASYSSYARRYQNMNCSTTFGSATFSTRLL
jgi:ribonuclease HI